MSLVRLSNLRWIYIMLLIEILTSDRSDVKEDAAAIKSVMRLYRDLLNPDSYNKVIRPVDRNEDVVSAFLGLKLTQILELNMRDQLVSTNVWMLLEWTDINLRWVPERYGGVTRIHIPSDKIWLPDIVLFNNADGRYEITIMTKAKVHHNGRVLWNPPAVFKSTCQVDVEFFPYDIQSCPLTFASWTYYGNKMSLKHYSQRGVHDPINATVMDVRIDYAVDLNNFYESVEFDILEFSGLRSVRLEPAHPDSPLHEVTFNLVMRRKTLFYTVNLMMPCLAMAFLSVLVFYLPAESGEKISLSINILLSLTLFFNLLVESTPSSNLVIPLIGKYLLFTIILISLSIIISVCVLNVKFRSALSSALSPAVRHFVFHILPPFLLVPTPCIAKTPASNQNASSVVLTNPSVAQPHTTRSSSIDVDLCKLGYRRMSPTAKYTLPDCPSRPETRSKCTSKSSSSSRIDRESDLRRKLKETVVSMEYIVQHLRDADNSSNIQGEWKFMAVMMDRFFLILFLIAYVISTLSIILRSPALRDNRSPLGQNDHPNSTMLTFISGSKHISISVNIN